MGKNVGAVFAEFASFHSNEFSLACAAFAGVRGRRSNMNYSLASSRLSRLDGGVGLLSSHVVYNTAYEGDVCRLLEEELP